MEDNSAPLKIMIVMYVLGISLMLPWNFFITANTFWQYKLRNTTLGDNWDDDDAELTQLQVAFTPSLQIISGSCMTLFTFFTSAISKRVSEKTRILTSLFITLISMGIITLLAVINTDDWQTIFFSIIMLIVATVNMAVAVLLASVFGMVGFFPSVCISALYAGQSVVGIFSSLAQIISLAIGQDNPITTGIIYFSMADVYLIFSIYAYLWIRRTEFYKEKVNVPETDKTDKKLTKKEYFRVFKKIFRLGLSLALVFMVTMTVFPSVAVYVTSVHSPSTWADTYFQPTITFLLYNLCDWLGRELTKWTTWPGNGYLYNVLAFSRIVFIPLILLCNGEDKTFATAFHYDFYYMIFIILLGLTMGYFGALAMLFYPSVVEKDEVELGGTLMASMMGAGGLIGSYSSPGFVALWGPKD